MITVVDHDFEQVHADVKSQFPAAEEMIDAFLARDVAQFREGLTSLKIGRFDRVRDLCALSRKIRFSEGRLSIAFQGDSIINDLVNMFKEAATLIIQQAERVESQSLKEYGKNIRHRSQRLAEEIKSTRSHCMLFTFGAYEDSRATII